MDFDDVRISRPDRLAIGGFFSANIAEALDKRRNITETRTPEEPFERHRSLDSDPLSEPELSRIKISVFSHSLPVRDGTFKVFFVKRHPRLSWSGGGAGTTSTGQTSPGFGE